MYKTNLPKYFPSAIFAFHLSLDVLSLVALSVAMHVANNKKTYLDFL